MPTSPKSKSGRGLGGAWDQETKNLPGGGHGQLGGLQLGLGDGLLTSPSFIPAQTLFSISSITTTLKQLGRISGQAAAGEAPPPSFFPQPGSCCRHPDSPVLLLLEMQPHLLLGSAEGRRPGERPRNMGPETGVKGDW